MPDNKDQFNFDDEEDFSPGSLGDRGTPSAEEPDSDLPQSDFQGYFPGEGRPVAGAEQPVSDMAGKFREGSRTHLLLGILVLVIIGAAGAYYFMGLGEAPEAPIVKVPPQSGTQSVPLPTQAAQPESEQGGKNLTLTEPPPACSGSGGRQA
jgi:hypothetical protein